MLLLLIVVVAVAVIAVVAVAESESVIRREAVIVISDSRGFASIAMVLLLFFVIPYQLNKST